MVRQELIDRIRIFAKEIADNNGVELIDIEFLGSGPKTILRVTIDKEGGVSLGECETVSRDLEAILDVEDLISSSYKLEVSSPGIDRQLKKIEDYVKYKGRKARIVTSDLVENRSFFLGYIRDMKDDVILFELEKKTVRIPFDLIKRANLEIEF